MPALLLCSSLLNSSELLFISFIFSFTPGLQRSAFDNKSVSFEEHTKVEHNMWHYLNFIVLVKVKKSTEFTGPESYVSEMVQVRACARLQQSNISVGV